MTEERMRITRWIPEATKTLMEYLILIVFHCNNDYMNAPRIYVTRTLSLMFSTAV
jgi:hypothetical protein